MDPPPSGKIKIPPPPIVVCQVDPSGSSQTMSVHHRWLEYRDERTSSSSSDSGVIVQLSPEVVQLSPDLPIAGLSSSPSPIPSTAFSPPGLSPLTVHDSAFSTPTSTINRFTFDHVPFCHSPKENEEKAVSSAFDVPSTSKKTDTLENVLKQVRGEIAGHQPLQRKHSVIQSARQLSPILTSSLSVGIGERTTDSLSQSLLSAHPLLSPSLSADSLQPSPRSAPDKSPSSVSSEALDDDDKKQYYCTICRKDFRRPDILSRHLRRHTGEKPFGCDDCGRFFSRSDHLRTHRRTHTDEKPYRCSLCNYAARRRDVLTRHISTRHQAKATSSHNDLRRCLSDGDAGGLNIPSRSIISTSPRRARHCTDVPVTQTNSSIYRVRTLTEAPREDEDFTEFNDIEDDVIIDVCEMDDEEYDEDETTPEATS